jgi:hypothetical protein
MKTTSFNLPEIRTADGSRVNTKNRGELYMDGKPSVLPPPTPEQAARLQATQEEYQRRKAAGTLNMGRW